MMISPLFTIGQTLLSGITGKLGGHSANKSSAQTSSATPSDQSQLSPFAHLMAQLQQQQQSDPTRYKQEAAQLANSLQQASATAQANGKSREATLLGELSGAFQTASTSGQMPEFAQAAAQGAAPTGHHHHHRGGSPMSQGLNPVAQNLLSSLRSTSGSATAGATQ
jgi:hypothetical protein